MYLHRILTNAKCIFLTSTKLRTHLHLSSCQTWRNHIHLQKLSPTATTNTIIIFTTKSTSYENPSVTATRTAHATVAWTHEFWSSPSRVTGNWFTGIASRHHQWSSHRDRCPTACTDLNTRPSFTMPISSNRPNSSPTKNKSQPTTSNSPAHKPTYYNRSPTTTKSISNPKHNSYPAPDIFIFHHCSQQTNTRQLPPDENSPEKLDCQTKSKIQSLRQPLTHHTTWTSNREPGVKRQKVEKCNVWGNRCIFS